MLKTLAKLHADLQEICNRYIYQSCTDKNMCAFENDCNRVIADANNVLIHYDIKAILNCHLDNAEIHGSIDLIDIRTGKIVN